MNRVGPLCRCFVLGAVLGTLLDGIHAYGDVLEYPDAAFGRWAWFVPVEFGLLGLGVGLAIPRLERLVARERVVSWPAGKRLIELLVFVALYGMTALVGSDGAPLLAIGLISLALARLLVAAAPGDWGYVLLAAALGPAAEAALVALGAFDYRHPDLLGIPYWLPGLWANGGFLVRRLFGPIVLETGSPERPRLLRGRGADRSLSRP